MYGALSYCHSCHIYGIWRSKEVGDALKKSFWVVMQATSRDNVFGKEGFSLCNTVVLKHYCKSYTVNYFTGYYLPLFHILLLFFMFCVY